MRLRVPSVLLLAGALAAGPLFGATPALAAEGTVVGAGSAEAIPGRFIVTLRHSDGAQATAASAAGLADTYGGTVIDSYEAVPAFTVRLGADAARRLAANPDVASVEQDRTLSMLADQTGAPWGLDRLDQAALPLDTVYRYPTTASTVHAYVIDTGIRITHTEFGGRASYGYDFADNDAVADDCNGHGTHVAGTVGGTVSGVAKGVQLVAVRVLGCDGSGSSSSVVAGVDWVTAHAVKPAVANMSIGGSVSTAIDNAVKASIVAGVTYAVAAGNSSVDACASSPARLAEAITVGATDQTDTRASFSNYGSCLDIFAPGVSIRSAYNTDDTAMAYMQGTSMATPHVAGAAALLLAANPTATPGQVRDGLVGAAGAGLVTDPGTGSPNRLLRITITPGVAPPPPPPPAPAPAPCGQKTNGADVSIRDRGMATSAVTVTGCSGRAGYAVIEVHIVHPRRGDLVVELVAPNGSVKRLKNSSTRDRAANLNTFYATRLNLRTRNGTWRLRVRDAYRGQTGYLDSWTLTV